MSHGYSLNTVPADSQYLVVWDTTWGMTPPQLPASAAAAPAPGPYRRKWECFRRVRLTVKNGDQAITIVFQAMTNPYATTASTAFETDLATGPSSGSATLALNTTTTYDWLMPTADSRIYILAGANNPDTLITTINTFEDANPGI